jgi:pimeloyl-ACP methyl ester carboxylesterase
MKTSLHLHKPSTLRALAATSLALMIAGCVGAQNVKHGYFFAGGQYIDTKGGQIMAGQMYVESRIPASVTKPYPIVMIHGAAQTGTNFTGTPDGRKGWADYFAEQGYAVYVVDQPARGRSADAGNAGSITRFTANILERRFTATAKFKEWPQAALHTQFPGEGPNKGQRGDPVFDQFYASQVQLLRPNSVSEKLVRDAGAALLDKIGPAIIFTHSQSGPFGWVIADERPKLVKGIVAAEPSGPPFRNAVFGTQPGRLWGVTETPMAYTPAVSNPKEIATVEESTADGPNLVKCMKQAEPARKLTNLQNLPVLVLAAEASYHAAYDHCTAKYLKQAGVKADFVRLEDVGIKGNGHMVMIEKNNLDIAAMINGWLDKNIR